MGIFDNLQSFYFSGQKKAEEEKKKDTPIMVLPSEPIKTEEETKPLENNGTFSLPEQPTTQSSTTQYFDNEKKKSIAYDFLKTINKNLYSIQQGIPEKSEIDAGLFKTLKDAGALVEDAAGKVDLEKSTDLYKKIKEGQAKPQEAGLEKGTTKEPSIVLPSPYKESSISKLPKDDIFTVALGKEILSNYAQSKKIFSEQPKATDEKFLAQDPIEKAKTSITTIKDVSTGVYNTIADKEARQNFKDALSGSILNLESALQSVAGSISNRLGKVGAASENEKKKLKQASDYLFKQADKNKELSNYINAGLPVVEGDTLSEKLKDKNFIAIGLGQNLPQLALSLGLSAPVAIAGAPLLVSGGIAFGTSAALEGGFAYQDAIDSGATPETAEKVMYLTGIANGLLETLPTGNILNRLTNGAQIRKKILGKIATNILEQTTLEASTESLQQITSNAVAQVYYDEQRNLLDGVSESAFFGGLMGGGSSLGVDVLNNIELKGLSIEDVTDISKRVNQENTMLFKRDVALGLREEDRVTGKTLENLKFQGIIPDTATENTIIEVYRAGKDDKIKTGDFVTTKPEIANNYLKLRPDSKVSTSKVRVGDLINSLGVNGEFLFAPEDYVKLTSRIEKLSEQERSIYDSIIGEDIATKLRNNESLSLEEEILAGDLLVDFKSDTLEDLDDVARKELDKELNDKRKVLNKLQKDIETAIGEEKKRQQTELKSLQKDIEDTIEKSKFLSPKEQEQISKLVIKQQKEGTLNSNIVTRKESVILRDKLREVSKAAREASKFTRSTIKDYQSQVKEIISGSEFDNLRQTDVKFILNQINKLNNNNINQARFDKITDLIDERLDKVVSKERITRDSNKLTKLLRNNKTKNVGGKRPTGKGLPYDTQLAIDTLNEANDLYLKKKKNFGWKKEIEKKIINNSVKIELDGDVSGELKFKNYYLQSFLDSKDISEVLQLTQSILDEGNVIKNLLDQNAQEEFERDKDFYLGKIYGSKKGELNRRPTPTEISQRSRVKEMYQNNIIKNAFDYIFSNYNVKLLELNSLNPVETDTKNPFNRWKFFREENKRVDMKQKFNDELKNKLIEIYGTGGKKPSLLQYSSIIKYLNKDVKVSDTITLTRDELIKEWMNLQHEGRNGNKEITLLSGKYSDDIVKRIEELVTDKDKEYANYQWEQYAKYGEIERQDYIKFKGLKLGYLGEKYSPIKILNYKPVNEDTFDVGVQERISRGLLFPVSTKERTGGSEGKIIKTESSTSVLQNYIDQVIRNHTYREQANYVDRFINDKEVATSIKYTRGEKFYQSLKSDIEKIKGKQTSKTIELLEKMRSNIVVTTLFGKFIQIPKQYTSIIAYADELTSTELAFGMTDYYKNRKANRAKMEELSSFFRNRGKNLDESLTATIDTGKISTSPLTSAMKEFGMKPTFIGDKAPILAGGWAMYLKKLKEYKLAEPLRDTRELEIKALEYAASFSNDTQQTKDKANLGEMQTGGSFEKIPVTYAQSNIGFQRKINSAIKSLFREGGTSTKNLKKVAKTIFIYHVMTNLLFQAAADIGDEDERRLLRAAIIGNLNKVFFGKDIIGSAWDLYVNGYSYGDNGIIQDKLNLLNKFIYFIDDEDITKDDYLEFLSDASEDVGSLFGYPTTFAKNFSEGARRVADGDYNRGLRLMAGQTIWQVDKNNPINRLITKSGMVKVSEEETKNIIQEALDSNDITVEYANELWKKIGEKQADYITEQNYKKVKNLKTQEAQDNYYNNLDDLQKRLLTNKVRSLFTEEKNRINDRYNIKLIDKEKGEQMWKDFKDTHWIPPDARE